MKSILYIIHIAWGWIKQRPQFLAEGLSEHYKVDVMYRMSNRNQKGVNAGSSSDNLSVDGFRSLPWERVKIMPQSLGNYFNRILWHSKSKHPNKYDFVWVTDPVLWKNLIAGKKLKGKLIYDCMDDYLAFPYMKKYPDYCKYMEKCERELLESADYVLCSAEALKDKLLSKYNISRQIHIVNNAITPDISKYENETDSVDIPKNTLTYIGTISEWIDFKNLLLLLDKNPDLHIVLYGPKRMPEIPSHERLQWRGTIAHDQILSVMNASSGLIMPFVVNELIESVNPVKLYEYIYTGKPIVASRYGETEKFDGLVTLYSNYDELQSFLDRFIFGNETLDKKTMQEYAMANTWDARKSQIISIIDGKA